MSLNNLRIFLFIVFFSIFQSCGELNKEESEVNEPLTVSIPSKVAKTNASDSLQKSPSQILSFEGAEKILSIANEKDTSQLNNVIKYCEDCIQKDSSVAECHLLQAKVYNKVKENQQSLSVLNLVIDTIKASGEIALQAYQLRATLHKSFSSNQKAIEDLSEVIKLTKDSTILLNSYLQRSDLFLALNNYKRVISDLSYIRSLSGGDSTIEAQSLLLQARTYRRMEKYEQSINSFSEFIKITGIDNYLILNERGETKLDHGDELKNKKFFSKANFVFKSAEGDFTKVIDLKNDFAKAYFNRGDALVSVVDKDRKGLARLKRAIQDFKKCLALDIQPKSLKAVAYFEMGGIETSLYNPSNTKEKPNALFRAIKYFEKSISNGYPPNNSKVHNALGDTYNILYTRQERLIPYKGEKLDKLKEYLIKAAENWYSAQKINPKLYIAANKKRASLYSEKGEINTVPNEESKMKRAKFFFQAASILDRNNYSIFRRWGQMHLDFEEYEDAIIKFTKDIELAPEDGGGYFSRGLAKKRMGNSTGACKDWQEAVQRNFKRARDLLKRNCG